MDTWGADERQPWADGDGVGHAQLTPRERQVLDYIAAGRSNKVVAIDLGISMRTVEKHRARIFSKLGVRNAVELVHQCYLKPVPLRLAGRSLMSPQAAYAPVQGGGWRRCQACGSVLGPSSVDVGQVDPSVADEGHS